MTTTPKTPVYSWLLCGNDRTVGFVERRYLLADHILSIYLYGPGKHPADGEWRRAQTFLFDSSDDAREYAVDLTGRDEALGYTMFGPVVRADVVVYHAIWENAAASDPSGIGHALNYVKNILLEVQATGTELG